MLEEDLYLNNINEVNLKDTNTYLKDSIDSLYDVRVNNKIKSFEKQYVNIEKLITNQKINFDTMKEFCLTLKKEKIPQRIIKLAQKEKFPAKVKNGYFIPSYERDFIISPSYWEKENLSLNHLIITISQFLLSDILLSTKIKTEENKELIFLDNELIIKNEMQNIFKGINKTQHEILKEYVDYFILQKQKYINTGILNKVIDKMVHNNEEFAENILKISKIVHNLKS